MNIKRKGGGGREELESNRGDTMII